MNRWNFVVDEMYRREANEAFEEIEKQAITLRLRATHLQMLPPFADRFPEESRAGLGVELLEHAVEQVFALLKAEDRDELARKADAAYTAFAKEKYETYESAGMGFWEGQNWIFTKAEEGGE